MPLSRYHCLRCQEEAERSGGVPLIAQEVILLQRRDEEVDDPPAVQAHRYEEFRQKGE